MERSQLLQRFSTFEVRTRGRGMVEMTDRLRAWIEEEELREGLLTLFLQHTSASLLIQENADPQVQRDLEAFFSRLVPDGDPLFLHRAEGPDDMPAHVRAALTQVQLAIPVQKGRLSLGSWQGIFVYEHRTHGHARSVIAHFLGNR
jgi:secondary thiamine-phosphate synthase enzyme